MGDIILQCPTCKTLIYRDINELEPSEETDTQGNKLYNVDMECPHCNSTNGFIVVGQVAKLDLDKENQEEEIDTESQDLEDNNSQDTQNNNQENNNQEVKNQDEEETSFNKPRFNAE